MYKYINTIDYFINKYDFTPITVYSEQATVKFKGKRKIKKEEMLTMLDTVKKQNLYLLATSLIDFYGDYFSF